MGLLRQQHQRRPNRQRIQTCFPEETSKPIHVQLDPKKGQSLCSDVARRQNFACLEPPREPQYKLWNVRGRC